MIVSRQNSQVKTLKSLTNKKFRDEMGCYLVEGVKMVGEAFSSKQNVLSVYATEKGASLVKEYSGAFITDILSDDVFKSISDVVTPQGVIAIVKKPNFELEKPQGSCLLLDGVSDPANVGAIIRTAASSGYNHIYLIDCADAYSPKAVRSSMSGIYHVNTYSGSAENVLSVIDKPIVVADMKGENVFDKHIDGDFCLVIGNEGHGVSDIVKSKATITVSIPMQNGMESLNAGVSAGILMYALKNTKKKK